MIRVTVRRARRERTCEGCLGTIRPGDRYLEHVASPHHDADSLGNARWWRSPECEECARRYGRPVPKGSVVA